MNKGKVKESLLSWVYSGKPPGLAEFDGLDLTARGKVTYRSCPGGKQHL